MFHSWATIRLMQFHFLHLKWSPFEWTHPKFLFQWNIISHESMTRTYIPYFMDRVGFFLYLSVSSPNVYWEPTILPDTARHQNTTVDLLHEVPWKQPHKPTFSLNVLCGHKVEGLWELSQGGLPGGGISSGVLMAVRVGRPRECQEHVCLEQCVCWGWIISLWWRVEWQEEGENSSRPSERE